MKTKNKIISLLVSVSLCLVALFNVVYFRNGNVKTHETIMNKTDIDYMSLLDEFDEKEIIIEDTRIKVNATQYLDSSFFDEIDNVSMANKKNYGSISYAVDYDETQNVFVMTITTVDLVGNEVVEDVIGVPFIDDNGEINAIFNDEGELFLLSELQEEGIENCGFFSKIKKGLKKAAKAMAVIAVVALTVAVVATVIATPVGGLVTSTGLILGGGGSTAAATVAAFATQTAIAAGTFAAAAYVGSVIGEIEERNENASSVAGSPMPGNNNNNNKSQKDKTKDLSDEVSDDLKVNGKCDKYADALENKMKESNISGERIKVQPKTGRDLIYSDKHGLIGNNGYHEGIKVGDYIFDNMNPQGISYNEWIADLGGNVYNSFEIIRSW